MINIAEQIAEYIYSQHGTHWKLLSEADRQFYIDYHYKKNISQFKLRSGKTLKELIDNDEQDFDKKVRLWKL